MFTDFDNWGETSFWPAITQKYGSGSGHTSKSKSSLQVEISSGMRASTLGLQLEEGFVIENKLLTKGDVPAKRILRFKLPSDMTYQCGDYLAVLPVNPTPIVRRAIRRFNLPWDAMLRIQKPQKTTAPPSIPLDTPISAFELLSTYVELSQPASKRDMNILADAAVQDAELQAELRYIASSPSRFTSEIVQKRLSPLDLLMRYPSINLPIGEFLAMLPPMRVRQYSISSSPLSDPTECSITFSVLKAPSLAAPAPNSTDEPQIDEAQYQYLGVASNYLSDLQPNERAHITVRPSHTGFKPPTDLSTPLIMACAGSGIAPFRGFIMDRAERIRGRQGSGSLSTTADTDSGNDKDSPGSEEPAKAILYAGCRTQGLDDIHTDELEAWARTGAVEVRWAFSRPSVNTAGDTGQGEHVQDLMLRDAVELVSLFENGARIYVCGSTGVGNAVKDACKKIYLERRRERIREKQVKGETLGSEDQVEEDVAAERFFDALRTKERYATDVFA